MARPKKKNADYFPHDADMRNDPKIKALRRKFGLTGYAVWNMIVEVLTDADYFEIEWNELNLELLSGDFDVEPELLQDIINYCLTVKLLEKEEGLIYTKKLKERFESVLIRREKDQKRKFSARKTPKEENEDTEKPQSKVKESKVLKNNTKKNNSNLAQRKEDFKNKLRECKSDKYDSELLKDFFIYWAEHGDNDKKMRWEKEKTFGIKSRLHTFWKFREQRKKEKPRL